MSGVCIKTDNLSKWYGKIIGLNSFNLEITSGITGLVGPNGAGKSTFFNLAIGMLQPKTGQIRVLGQRPWMNPQLRSQIGFCPDYDNLSDDATGKEFLELVGGLHGMSGNRLHQRINEVTMIVGITDALPRKIGGYSKGMRQRIKLAGSIIHNPKLLLLDEPLSGADPQARKSLINVIKSLHTDLGHDIVVSSHVLYEIERMTSKIALIYKGRAIASGEIPEIRNLIDEYPHNIIIEGTKLNLLAKHLLDKKYTISVGFQDNRKKIKVQVSKPDEFFDGIGRLIAELNCEIEQLYSLDDNLEAVFQYLVER
jgi:ABC-2 type transport system ATP-binding protein